MKKDSFIFGIALTDSFETKDYAEHLSKNYDLEVSDIEKLKPAYLFRLSDNVRYQVFDADIVFFDKEAETYYHTSEYQPIAQVANNEIVALVNDDNECELIK